MEDQTETESETQNKPKLISRTRTHRDETIVAKMQISQLYKETERHANALDGIAAAHATA
jgi:hypothetical protein